eukprot:6462922-Pyramimonas_sp.AAC.1
MFKAPHAVRRTGSILHHPVDTNLTPFGLRSTPLNTNYIPCAVSLCAIALSIVRGTSCAVICIRFSP